MKKAILLAALLLSGCTSQTKGPTCKDAASCVNDPKCLCWCSQSCGFRAKKASDHPVYIENDANGKFCYCKQWDYDRYESNCIRGEGIKQPANAQ